MMKEVQLCRHVFDREVPEESLEEVFEVAGRHHIGVSAQRLSDGRIVVTLKKLIEGER